jgi:hypothetical protein
MGSVNKVILVGNLGRDAELRYTPGGAAVATINMATTEVWNDKAGQRQEKTEWHRVVLWGKSAESLASLARRLENAGQPEDRGKVERQIGRNMSFSASYIMVNVHHLNHPQDINAPNTDQLRENFRRFAVNNPAFTGCTSATSRDRPPSSRLRNG